jgi:hypothetical protein
MLFYSGNPIPTTTYAQQCCVRIFTNFSSIRMSSCSCWKAARSVTQTTTHAHLRVCHQPKTVTQNELFLEH